jgi:hypothetical protein
MKKAINFKSIHGGHQMGKTKTQFDEKVAEQEAEAAAFFSDERIAEHERRKAIRRMDEVVSNIERYLDSRKEELRRYQGNKVGFYSMLEHGNLL